MSRHDQAFQPHNGGIGTVSVSVTSTSASVAIPTLEGHAQLRLVNAGAAVTFCRLGIGSATALGTDLPLPPNSVTIITVPEQLSNLGTVYLAAIGTAGNTLYATPGDGL